MPMKKTALQKRETIKHRCSQCSTVCGSSPQLGHLVLIVVVVVVVQAGA